MKKLLTILMLSISLISYGQTKKNKTVEIGKFGTISADYRCEMTDKSNFTYVSLIFQNAKYTHITDSGIILFRDSTSIMDFSEALIQASSSIKNNSEWDIGRYVISTPTFINKVMVSIKKGGEYTYLSKKKSIELGETLKRYHKLGNIKK